MRILLMTPFSIVSTDGWVCQFCNQNLLKDLDSLISHSKFCKHAPRPNKSHSYVCFKCNYHSEFVNHTKDHIKKHMKVENFGCPYCPYTAKKRSQVKNHMICKHSNAPRMKCQFCNFTTKLVPQLKFHVNHKHICA